MPWERRHSFATRRAFALALLAALLLFGSGCASAPRAPVTSVTTDTESLWKLYEQAVAAAKYPQPGHVSTKLVPILRYTPGLVWDESGQKVLMATWSKAQYYTGKPPYDYTVPVKAWLTAVPFLQRFCRQTALQGDALRLRVAERLGLPPDASNDAIVQMWVDPHTFFRPCPDPEVTDHECEVNLTPDPVDPSAPCPWSAALQSQLSGNFVAVSESHLNWMCSNWTNTYPPGDPRHSYPWTALGYTYDWGGSDFHGESEFVLPANTQVVVESVTLTDAYCAPHLM
jgi:hypothetical protein